MSITIKPYLRVPIIKTPTTTTTPFINYPATVSATPRRKHTTIKARNSGEEIGGLGHAVLSAIESNTVESPSNTATSTENRKRKEKLGIVEEERTITGSDVLWALQKATTVKKKKRIVKKKKMVKNGDESEYNNTSGSDVDEEDYLSNVKPLNVKDEWIHKLDDLDLLLKQLSEI